MKIIILTDNKACDNMKGEWGLSVYIEHENKKLLLDTGSSPLFAENAEKCGVDLSAVDMAFLSHAHYDHSNGFGKFMELNSSSPLYLNETCKENCYGKRWIFSKYIGIKKGYCEKYKDRLIYTKGLTEISPDIFLLPHNGDDYSIYGKKNGLYQKNGRRFCYDSFDHEQSLIIKTDKGIVILNSCCHTGADNIIKEVCAAFPDEKILALIGGFHLYKSDENEVLSLAKRIKDTGIGKIYTGHCTGDKAFAVLKKELGEKAEEIYAGKVILI